MQERESGTPELTPQQIQIEQCRDQAYGRCFWMLGDATEAETIDFESGELITQSSKDLEITYGYDSDATLIPTNTRRLDTACIRMSTALKYLAIVFDRAQVAVSPDKVQPSMLKLNSVAIPTEQVAPYETEFERLEEDLKEAIELGIGAGMLAAYDALVDETGQKHLNRFMDTPTGINDLTVKTKIQGVFWSVERTSEGICSWLLVEPLKERSVF